MTKKTVFILLGIVVVLLAILAIWPKNITVPGAVVPGPVACTMEAKICPDGSSVGRTGPNCEFAACPNVATTTMRTYTNATSGVSFMYPMLSTTYIRAVDWPPAVAVENYPLTCTPAGSVNAQAGQTVKKTVNGRVYCVTTEGEGAAGSTYLNYAYATQIGNKTAILTFSLQEVQCLNYDQPQSSQCTAERNSFSIDPIVDQIVNTLKI